MSEASVSGLRRHVVPRNDMDAVIASRRLGHRERSAAKSKDVAIP
jgi:hypothetical protein